MDIKETSRSICNKACSRADRALLVRFRIHYYHMEATQECTLRANRQAASRTVLRLPPRADRMARRCNTRLVHCPLSRSQRLRAHGRRRILHHCILLFDRSTTRCSTTNIKPLQRQVHIRVRLIKLNNLTRAPSPLHLNTTRSRIHCRHTLMEFLHTTLPCHKHHKCINSKASHRCISRNIKLTHNLNIREIRLCMHTSSTSKSHRLRRQRCTHRSRSRRLKPSRMETCLMYQLILRR